MKTIIHEGRVFDIDKDGRDIILQCRDGGDDIHIRDGVAEVQRLAKQQFGPYPDMEHYLDELVAEILGVGELKIVKVAP